jgi:hypothetical protein
VKLGALAAARAPPIVDTRNPDWTFLAVIGCLINLLAVIPDGAGLPRGIHRIDVIYRLGVHSRIQAEPMSRGLGSVGRAFCLMRHRDHFAGQPIGAEMRGARHASIVTAASSATANLPPLPLAGGRCSSLRYCYCLRRSRAVCKVIHVDSHPTDQFSRG